MRSFILGTDWWDDCDDAVAIRLLSRAHKSGEIRLKGIGINACMEHSVKSLDAFLRAEGVSDIPLGIDHDATDFGGSPSYQKRLCELPTTYTSNFEAEDAVRLYRRILAESEAKIEIIEIGFLQVIANVLKSKADDISLLSGIELVREKVSKIWVMAGKWDEMCGIENNFARNERARIGAGIFCEICPVPVTFLGFEVGESVITGGNLKQGDVLHQILCDHGSKNGRMSWDPMLVHLALVGDETQAGYDTVCGTASVNQVNGENTFTPSEDGNHRYVIKIKQNEYYENTINAMLV